MANQKTPVNQGGLSQQLANKAAAGPTKGTTIFQLMNDMAPAISQAIPSHMSVDRLLRIATTSIRTNPKLGLCTPKSLLGAVMQCAQLGLEPSLMGHAYLIPYQNKGVDECQLQIGYKGLIELARRTGQISTITAREVYEKDQFEYAYGLEDKLVHVPADGDRGQVTKYYALAKFKDGGYAFSVMSKRDIEIHRDRFSKAKKYGPWVDNFDAMAKKTVIKDLMKYMPISIEFQTQVSQDETTKYFDGTTKDMAEMVDVTDWQEVQEDEAEVLEYGGIQPGNMQQDHEPLDMDKQLPFEDGNQAKLFE